MQLLSPLRTVDVLHVRPRYVCVSMVRVPVEVSRNGLFETRLSTCFLCFLFVCESMIYTVRGKCWTFVCFVISGCHMSVI